MATPFASLFPLPLTPFEQFLLAEDRDGYPACPVVMAELSGTLDEDAFRDAVHQAVRRHPLFNATIRLRSFRAPHWVETPAVPDVSFQTAGGIAGDGVRHLTPPDEFEPIDITAEPGLRLRVTAGSERTIVSCQVHHCCADGPGIHRFLGDVLAIYGQMTAFNEPPELLPLDAAALRERGEWPPELRRQLWTPRYWFEFLRSLRRFLFRIPSPVSAADEATRIPTVRAHTCYLEPADVQCLRRIAQERQLTINDLLACELFQCLRQWNEERGGSPRQFLRLVIPTDLRSGDRGRLPAANCLHVAFIGFRIGQIRKLPDLGAACKRELRALFETNSSSHFDLGLAFTSWIPGLLEWLASRTKRKATAMLSSLGDPTRFYAARFPRAGGRLVAGSLVLERLWVRSLVRPGTYVNISTSLCADRMAISATVDEGHCGSGAARYFAAEMRNRLLALLPADRPRQE